MPPPRVSPPTPVVDRNPDGVARPNPPVAWSTSPQTQPPSARTVLSAGSTVTPRIVDRSMTSASSHTPRPAALCPPPRTETVWPLPPANLTAVMTSATSAQRAIAAGLRSIIPL